MAPTPPYVCFFFFSFFNTLDSGARRPLRLESSDANLTHPDAGAAAGRGCLEIRVSDLGFRGLGSILGFCV